jgi:hypothetical protein
MSDPAAPRIAALERGDPPALGDVLLTGRLDADESAVVFAGEREGEPVVAVMLSDGAAADSFARARFRDAVEERQRRSDHVIEFENNTQFAPWVAVSAESYTAGASVASSLIEAITLADREAIGSKKGPDYLPHWYKEGRLGRWRIWPLPWPRWLRSVGMWTFSAAFALVLAIATTALIISVLALRTLPPPPVPPSPSTGPGLPIPPIPTPSRTSPPTTTPGSPTPSTGPSGPSPTPTGPRGPTGQPPIV